MFISKNLRHYYEDSLPGLTYLVCLSGYAFMVSKFDVSGIATTLSVLLLGFVSYLFLCRQSNIAESYFSHIGNEKLAAISVLQNAAFSFVNGIGLTTVALSGITSSLGASVLSIAIASAMVVFWVNVLFESADELKEMHTVQRA